MTANYISAYGSAANTTVIQEMVIPWRGRITQAVLNCTGYINAAAENNYYAQVFLARSSDATGTIGQLSRTTANLIATARIVLANNATFAVFDNVTIAVPLNYPVQEGSRLWAYFNAGLIVQMTGYVILQVEST